MARYISEVTLNKPIDVVSMVMEDYTYHEKYRRADWNGEMVFMKEEAYGGNRYLLWYYAAGVLHIEAWKKGALGGEAGPGPAVISELNGLIYRIRKQDEGKIAGGHIGSDPLHHDSNHQSNHETLRQDTAWQGNQSAARPTTQNAAGNGQEAMGSAFVLLVLAFCTMGPLPILSIIFAVAAKKKCKRKGLAGFALCSAVATFVIIVSIIMMVSYMVGPLVSSGFMNMAIDYIRQYF